MLSKCSTYLTLQRITGLWLCLEKRIVGVENVVENEEYNHFDTLILHTSPNSGELTKHRTCETTIVKKSIYRNQGRKSEPNFC
jgi:hypothetical protein